MATRPDIIGAFWCRTCKKVKVVTTAQLGMKRCPGCGTKLKTPVPVESPASIDRQETAHTT